MSSQNWQDWSLEDLKQLVDETRPTLLKESTGHFQQTASHLSGVQGTFMAHMRALGNAWQGKAATAAINNAQTTYESMDTTTSTSASAAEQTTAYQADLADHQQQANAVPNVDTSWGHAASSGGWAGAIGIGVAKYEQQQKYDQNRDQVVQIVEQMDSGGNEQAAAMSDSGWPSSTTAIDAPPATLPPVPGAAKPKGPAVPTNPTGGSGSGHNSPTNPTGGSGSGHNSGGGSGSSPVGVGTPSHPGSVLHGAKGHHPAGGGPSTTSPSGTPTPGDPTVSQGVGGDPGGAVPGGSPVASPPVTGVPAGAGAAAAVLGGAGLIGAGTAGGRGLLTGAGAGAGARSGGAAGEPEGRLAAKGGSGLGDGEGGGMRGGSGGVGADNGGLRAGARATSGIPAEDDLGAGRGSVARGVGSGGFGGEPVAAEAGRTGGYPMGGGGGRRRSDDEEAPMPDYLVETDDVWGDGASAAPPVIGE